jgi:hypothetical protein
MVPASRRAQVKQWEVAAFPQLLWPSEGNRFSLGGITMAAHLTDGVTMVIIKNLGTVSVWSCKVRLEAMKMSKEGLTKVKNMRKDELRGDRKLISM